LLHRSIEVAMNDLPRPITGWTPSTPPVSGETLPALLQQHRAVVVHFWAEWNGYDPVVDRNLQALQPAFEGRAYFCSCNMDPRENWELCRSCDVLNIPTLACFVEGERRRNLVGCLEPDRLEAALEACLRDCSGKATP
jgi:hypothetical protein